MIPAIKTKHPIGELQDYEIEFGEEHYVSFSNVRCDHNFGKSLESMQGTLYCTNYKIIFKPTKN